MNALLIALVVAVIIAVGVVVLLFRPSRGHGLLARLRQPVDDEMTPSQRVKSMSNHPGAGGRG